MAKIRFGYSDDFTAKNSKVGINTTDSQANLDVIGVVKGQDLKVTGISSQTGYEGFLRADHQIEENTQLNFGQGVNSSLSGEIIVGTGVTVTIASVGLGTTMVGNGSETIENTIDTTDTNIAGGSQVECMKVYNTFTPPSGDTNQRPSKPKPGQLYYNYDLKTIEFYDGYGWRQVDNTTRSGRGVFAGGAVGPADSSLIEYINISSQGNAINFGNLTTSRRFTNSCASSVRGIIHGGTSQTGMDYITIASEGNGITFGTANTKASCASASSSTRGLFAGGYQPANASNIIEYVEISTLGSPVDFGDLTQGRQGVAGLSSPTRAVFAGGNSGPEFIQFYSIIDYVTISSLGNATDFGDLISTRSQLASASNGVRGVFSSGYSYFSPTVAYTDSTDIITIASTGNAVDFGKPTQSCTQRYGGCSTKTRGVFGGGYVPSTNTNVMEYITFESSGNAQDFGDLSQQRRALTGCSDSHGGLGGF